MYRHCNRVKKCPIVKVNRINNPMRILTSTVCGISRIELALLVNEGFLLVDGEKGVQKIYVKLR